MLARQRTFRGLLHHGVVYGIFTHPAGIFAQAQAVWLRQESERSAVTSDEDLWQVNLLAGWRSPRRRWETTVGILNVNNQDYRLDPINLYSELPRERTWVVATRFRF